MGSLQGGCRVLKVRGVRDVLARLSKGGHLSRGSMYGIVRSTTQDDFGQNWREDLYGDLWIGRGKTAKDFGAVFDELVKTKAIRPGLVLTCGRCHKRDWYHIGEVGEEFTCRYCFEAQRSRLESAKEWHYKADGLFQIPDGALGSIATIALLWRLEDAAGMSSSRFISSVNFKDHSGRIVAELDCGLLSLDWGTTAYTLILGEAKNFEEHTQEQLDRVMALVDRFACKPFIAVSTMRDRFSDSEKALLSGYIGRGYKVVPLTREELDPYHLFSRFEGALHNHPVNFGEFMENCVFLNLSS